MIVIPIGNDVDIVFDGVQYKNPTNPALPYHNSISDLAFSLYDENGTVVSGVSPLDMDYRSSSDGFYIGVLPRSVSATLTEDAAYTCKIVSALYGIERHEKCVAKYIP